MNGMQSVNDSNRMERNAGLMNRSGATNPTKGSQKQSTLINETSQQVNVTGPLDAGNNVGRNAASLEPLASGGTRQSAHKPFDMQKFLDNDDGDLL